MQYFKRTLNNGICVVSLNTSVHENILTLRVFKVVILGFLTK